MTKADQSEAQVSIFWMLGDRLVLDANPLSQDEPYGDCLGHKRSHIDFWTEQQAQGIVPCDIEYEEAPRGRVTFNTKTKQFVFYADRCILKGKPAVIQVMRTMYLPVERTDAATDEHYRCTRCLEAAQELPTAPWV
jgi:hypothetical protein